MSKGRVFLFKVAYRSIREAAIWNPSPTLQDLLNYLSFIYIKIVLPEKKLDLWEIHSGRKKPIQIK